MADSSQYLGLPESLVAMDMDSASNSEELSSAGIPSGEDPQSLAHSLLQFTNTFIFSPASNNAASLCEVPGDLALEPLRQRRAHHKSKRGCDQCRKRRVKCDEKYPKCSACVRRQEPCERRGQSPGVRPNEDPTNSEPAPSSLLPQRLPEQERPPDGVVNLLHMKLFHHFEHITIPTLTFGRDIWDQALQLSFRFESLMHAILCLAARHLTFLNPDEPQYATVAATHLSRSLVLFRDDLSTSFSSSNVDAFMSTAILLHYEMWTNTDFAVINPNGSMTYHPSEDRLFKHSTGVSRVFLNSVPFFFERPSLFVAHVRHSPRSILVKAAQLSKATLREFISYFAYDKPLHRDMLSVPFSFVRGSELAPEESWSVQGSEMEENQETPFGSNDPVKSYSAVLPRLCLIMSFVPEAEEKGGLSAEILRDLSRYILSFSVIADGQFISMVRQGDPHALLLLYHFYRAARILLPRTEFWWAYKRASVAEAVLRDWLMKEFSRP